MAQCIDDYLTADWAFYRFKPSTAAAVIFIVLFILTTTLHAFQMWKAKTWYMTAFCIGGVCEIIGYIGRAVNTTERVGCWSLGPYVIQSVLLLVAPALMAASIYMVLSRIILLTEAECHAIIERRWLTKIFVVSDVISLFLQAGGGSIMGGAKPNNNLKDIGEHVIVAGLFVQLFVFGIFTIVAGLFHRRMLLAPTAKSQEPLIRWQSYLTTLYVTSALIWVRSLFRVIEYLQGNNGTIMRHEAYIFIFDATLMFIVMIWMNWFHPSEIGLLLRNEELSTNNYKLLGLNIRV